MIFGIILLVILGLSIFFDVLIAFNLKRLNKKIKKRDNIIFSLLAQQYDLLVLLAKMIQEENVKLPEDLLFSLNLHDNQKELSTIERFNIKTAIIKTANGLLLVAETTSLVNQEKFLALKNSLNTFTKDYRKEVVLLNQDIYAYNYWVDFFLFKLVAKIFKLEKKESLQ